jgi:hypothetical protein
MIAQGELVALFAEAMERRGYATIRHEDWLEHRESGIAIYPRLLEPGLSPPFVRSVVVVTTDHPRFPPDGIVEYQHAVAETETDAVRDGVDQWLQIDLTVLLDALRDRPEHCMVMQWEPPEGDSPELLRRVLFGPVGRLVSEPERLVQDVEHPFCPCCLFTNTHIAFQSHIQASDFYSIRLLVSRDKDGLIEADCRINGHEWEVGKKALCAYAETWPQAGLEMRKQYVVLQSVARSLV